MNDIFAPILQATRPGISAGPKAVPRRHGGLATLLNLLATWEERRRFRWELEQKSKASPHLIDDIGLTERQVEAEVAKPFWQA
ncbi:DUF1127 domain-containing protein [Mesorhizobium sp. ASY16-5R]|uniref:DUF1127 domain-containing protein n=1 Tax=Mesorhizobium sp. ASY16-5R TaxID=3445772 RepID=UPI003FA16162